LLCRAQATNYLTRWTSHTIRNSLCLPLTPGSKRTLSLVVPTVNTSSSTPSTDSTDFWPLPVIRWLGSRVVSVLDSGAEGPEFKSQSRRCRVTVLEANCSHPLCLCSPSSKIGSSPLKGCGVTAGLAESNGSLPPGL